MPFTLRVKPHCVELEGVYESVADAIAEYQSEGMTNFRAMIRADYNGKEPDITVHVPTSTESSTATADNTTPAPPAPAAKPRGRPKKNQPDPTTASAPPPAPVPSTPAPAAPSLAIPEDGSIPPFLQRPAPPTAAPAAPPAPPAPPAAAPAAAPACILGNKIKAHIEAAAATDDAKGQWLKYLVDMGLVIPAATFEEAMGVLQYTTDPQAGPLAKALSIA